MYPDNGPSDDGVLADSSDEEDDSSSISSKGDCEQPEESPVRMFFGEEPLRIVHLFLEWTPDFIYDGGHSLKVCPPPPSLETKRTEE